MTCNLLRVRGDLIPMILKAKSSDHSTSSPGKCVGIQIPGPHPNPDDH